MKSTGSRAILGANRRQYVMLHIITRPTVLLVVLVSALAVLPQAAAVAAQGTGAIEGKVQVTGNSDRVVGPFYLVLTGINKCV